MEKIKEFLNNIWLLRQDKKNIIIFSVIAGLIVVGSLLYALRYNIMFFASSLAKPTRIYTLDASKKNAVYPYEDNLLVVNNDGVTCINKSGKKEFSVKAKTSDPLVRTAGEYIIVADKGGSEVYVIHKGQLAHNFSAENTIINCSINKKGRAVLVINETSYRNVIMAYNSHGDELYKWKISDFYVTDAVMSEDGSRIAATYISTDKQELTGGVVMVNIRREKILGKLSYEDCVFPFVAFNGNNSATAIGDIMMVGIDKNGKEDWKIDYRDKKLQTFGFREGDGAILAFANNANNSTLVSYNDNGRERGSIRLEFSANNIDMRPGLTLATGSDGLVAVDKRCHKRLSLNFEQEYKYGWFRDNKSLVYLVNGSNIEVIKL